MSRVFPRILPAQSPPLVASVPRPLQSVWKVRDDDRLHVGTHALMAFAAVMALISVLVFRTLAATPSDAAAPAIILIQNATILTVSHGTIEHGSILIRDGKIAAVGQSMPSAKGAEVIDANGQFVMPGIIDCHSHIAVDGSVNEGSVSVSSMVNIADVLNPDDIDIYRDLAGGVTVANVLHGSANSIGGQTVVIKLRWGAASLAVAV